MKHRVFLVSLLFLLSYGSQARAQGYIINDLGQISPTAINLWGEVAGNLNGHAYFWGHSISHDLGTLPGGTFSNALAIDDFGRIFGTADGVGTVISLDSNLQNQTCTDLTQPFLWVPGKPLKGLGTVGVPDETYYSAWCEIPFYGTGIDIKGDIVGYTVAFGDSYQWAFLGTTSEDVTALYGSSFPPTMVNGINNQGVAVGQTGVLLGLATSWIKGVPTNLGALASGYSSSANGINVQGQVVGWSTTVPETDCYDDFTLCPIHAVHWDQNGVIEDLGTLPGDTYSAASNINAFGVVIGASGNTLVGLGWGGVGGSGFNGNGGALAVTGSPFVWSAQHGMRDLNTLIRNGHGWVLDSVSGLNFWGQVVGSGTLNGQTHGFLLTPTIGWQP